MELPWIAEARKYIGVTEAPGEANNPEVVQFFKDIKRSGIKDDSVPWCAAFVGAVLEHCGIESTRFEGALSYRNWGKPLTKPAYGAIVVMQRDGGGHVGFCVGADKTGQIMVLGGNQNDAVNIRAFSPSRIVNWRWPKESPIPAFRPLPFYLDSQESTSEA